MTTKSYKDRLIVTSCERDRDTRRWKPNVQIVRKFEIDGEFDTREAAEDAALKWAIRWVDKRQN